MIIGKLVTGNWGTGYWITRKLVISELDICNPIHQQTNSPLH